MRIYFYLAGQKELPCRPFLFSQVPGSKQTDGKFTKKGEQYPENHNLTGWKEMLILVCITSISWKYE